MPSTPSSFKPFRVFAPAKVNLYLHVTGRKDNGYHMLDSLIAFADIGDDVVFTPHDGFSFQVKGPFAAGFSDKERDFSPHSSNIVAKTVWAAAQLYRKTPNFEITLTKNLPMGAGIGGGSSDAAATLWGLCELWDIPKNDPGLLGLMSTLGADVPVCFACETTRIQGIGDILMPHDGFDEIPVVLIYPGKPCETKAVFTHFGGGFKPLAAVPEHFADSGALISFLRKHTGNALSLPASDHVPEIENILNALNMQQTCDFARMTGSGSSCFGFFKTMKDAEKAASTISQQNPDWWVKTAWLGRPERY